LFKVNLQTGNTEPVTSDSNLFQVCQEQLSGSNAKFRFELKSPTNRVTTKKIEPSQLKNKKNNLVPISSRTETTVVLEDDDDDTPKSPPSTPKKSPTTSKKSPTKTTTPNKSVTTTPNKPVTTTPKQPLAKLVVRVTTTDDDALKPIGLQKTYKAVVVDASMTADALNSKMKTLLCKGLREEQQNLLLAIISDYCVFIKIGEKGKPIPLSGNIYETIAAHKSNMTLIYCQMKRSKETDQLRKTLVAAPIWGANASEMAKKRKEEKKKRKEQERIQALARQFLCAPNDPIDLGQSYRPHLYGRSGAFVDDSERILASGQLFLSRHQLKFQCTNNASATTDFVLE